LTLMYQFPASKLTSRSKKKCVPLTPTSIPVTS